MKEIAVSTDRVRYWLAKVQAYNEQLYDDTLDWPHECTPCYCSRCDWIWRSVAEAQDRAAALICAALGEPNSDAPDAMTAAEWLREAIASYDALRAKWTEEGAGSGWAAGDARRQEDMAWCRALLDAWEQRATVPFEAWYGLMEKKRDEDGKRGGITE